jgi:hypothetical protein
MDALDVWTDGSTAVCSILNPIAVVPWQLGATGDSSSFASSMAGACWDISAGGGC